MSNAEPLLVQAIYSFKGKNNDEVRGFRTNGNETCKMQRERLHMISSDVLFHSLCYYVTTSVGSTDRY